MTVDRLELEALAYAAWPSSSPEDRCARKMVEILARNKHGPNGSYSMRASSVGIELSKMDPVAFRSMNGLKAIVAHAAPHVCVVDDPTCTNPVNAGLRLLHKSLRSQTRPQLHQLASQNSAESSATNDNGSASSDGKDETLPPSLRTPEQRSPSPIMTRARLCNEGASADNFAPAAPLDMRLLALAAYPPQHRPANSVTFEDNLQHLRCATACFLLSPECAKGVVGPYSAIGARVCNVLRASLGVRWGAVSGKGSRLNLIQDKVILLRPYSTQQDAVAVQLDLGKLQERAMRSVAKALPMGLTDSSTQVPPPGARAPQPKPGVNPIVQDASNLPLQPEIEGALAPLLEAGFPGPSPLHVLRRKAAVLLLAYSIAVHSTESDKFQDTGPVPEPDPDGWQLCTKRKPGTAWNRRAPSIADLATSANGFGAMPCTFLGSALHKMMPQMYVQLPPSNGGKRLKSLYQEVPCFVIYPGPRQSESYLKLDVPILARMGACSADDLQRACDAIAALGGTSHSHLPGGEHYVLPLAPCTPPSAAESGPLQRAPDSLPCAASQEQPVAEQCSSTAVLPKAQQDAGALRSTAEQEQEQQQQPHSSNFAATTIALPYAWQVDNGAPPASQPQPATTDPWAIYDGHTGFTTLPPAIPGSTPTMLSEIASSSGFVPLQGLAPQQSQGCVSMPVPAAALPSEVRGPTYPPGFGPQGYAFGSAAGNSWTETADEAVSEMLSLLLDK